MKIDRRKFMFLALSMSAAGAAGCVIKPAPANPPPNSNPPPVPLGDKTAPDGEAAPASAPVGEGYRSREGYPSGEGEGYPIGALDPADDWWS